jgi:hypothetical protein
VQAKNNTPSERESFFTTNGATSFLSKIGTEKPTSSVLLSNPFTKDVFAVQMVRTSVHGVVLSADIGPSGDLYQTGAMSSPASTSGGGLLSSLLVLGYLGTALVTPIACISVTGDTRSF